MTKRRYNTRIGNWVDGDSGFLSNGTPFRLVNVKAPEKHQFGGETATRRAAGITGRYNGRVTAIDYGKDKYGRHLLDLFNKDGHINERLRRKRRR